MFQRLNPSCKYCRAIGHLTLLASAIVAADARADFEVIINPTHLKWVGNYGTGASLYSACVDLVSGIGQNVASWCGASAPTVPPDGYAQIYGGWLSDKTLPPGVTRFYMLAAYACTNSDKMRYFTDTNRCIGIIKVPTPTPSSPKSNGASCPDNPQDRQPSCGNPIAIGSGMKVQYEVDYADHSPGLALSLHRTYNNGANAVVGAAGSFGSHWSHPIDRKAVLLPNRTEVRCYTRNDTRVQFCDNAPVPNAPQAVSVTRPDGRVYTYSRAGDLWSGDGDVNDRISTQYAADGVTPAGWTYVMAHGDTEQYDAGGKLLSITSRSGASHRYTYSTGNGNDTSVSRQPADAPVCSNIQSGAPIKADLPVCVTDNWGRQLQFEYDSQARIVKALDPANQSYLYAYDGPSGGCVNTDATNKACGTGNLTQVTYPDGKKKTYSYNESAWINNGSACSNALQVGNGYGHLLNSLTGITDENGARYASWSYSCAGAVLSSQHAGGVDKVSVAYGAPAADGSQTVAVTSYLGTTANPASIVRNYHFKVVLGVAKNDAIDQPCAGCDGMLARTYDANGNVLTSKDWNGNLTTYAYDATRNLETSRTEASGTTAARTTNTEWHPTLRLRARVAEPLRLTTFSYDAAVNLTTQSVQATSDATGAQGFKAPLLGTVRSWSYTYNELGQLLTATGPLNDVTRYVYDSQNRLSRIANAAGHVTSYDNYDTNGRLGRIIDPNGLATDFSYTPRGWLATTTTGGATTSYVYDGVGQVTKVTLPDGAALNYTYDAAHRLTGIADSTGNSVSYTLDLAGNRIGEQVKNTDGTLARQITRAYNTLNRLQQVTGALQ